MNPSAVTSPAPPRRSAVQRTLLEAVLVVGLGTGLGLVGNSLSPRGLSLGRDYFPKAGPPNPTPALAGPLPTPGPTQAGTGPTNGGAAVVPSSGTPAPTVAASVAPANVPSDLEARLQARGLRLGPHAEVETLFRDPRYESELIVFVDARKEALHGAGHIPGAFQFDHYHPEKYLPELLPACQLAEVVVVYCTGGHCEDSEFAANLLKEAGVPATKLLVYGGGIEEWTSRKLPIETGPRRSGQIQSSPSP